MKLSTTAFTLISTLVASALAAPAPAPSPSPSTNLPPIPTPPPPGHTTITGPMGVQIHESCNATNRNQLIHALRETELISTVARDYILVHGPHSPLYRKFFGSGSSAEALGWFQKLISPENKEGVLLRCDDIDGNCHQDGWAGHWRGENGTDETVICDLSYRSRRPLEHMCAFGYEVAKYKTNVFFASDLVHRFFHVPKVSDGIVDHFTDSYEECLEFAKKNGSFAVKNTNSLQFFALEAYAYEVAIPGVGCAGEAPTSTQVPPGSTVTETPKPNTTTSAPKECHTHSDGIIHCD